MHLRFGTCFSPDWPLEGYATLIEFLDRDSAAPSVSIVIQPFEVSRLPAVVDCSFTWAVEPKDGEEALWVYERSVDSKRRSGSGGVARVLIALGWPNIAANSEAIREMVAVMPFQTRLFVLKAA